MYNFNNLDNLDCQTYINIFNKINNIYICIVKLKF